MKTKILLSIVLVISCAVFGSKTYSELYNITPRSGINNETTSVRGAQYITVDKNRIVSEIPRGQRVKAGDEAKYNRDLEGWLAPKNSALAPSQREDGIRFGNGMGVDRDILRESDAMSNGTIDARQAHCIREDSGH